MRLDPEFAAYLDRVARELPPPTPLDIPARRARMEAIQRRFPPPPDAVERVDHVVALPGRDVRVRVYRPAAGTRAAIVYFHGGGWVAGSVLTHDGACAALAQDAQAVVASVDYRLRRSIRFRTPTTTRSTRSRGSSRMRASSASTRPGSPSAATAPARISPRGWRTRHAIAALRWRSSC